EHLFLFTPYAPHRHLHSFPTRRSSDLPPRLASRGHAPARNRARATRPTRQEPTGSCAHPDPTPRSRFHRKCSGSACSAPGRNARSEEHTSELQSLAYLVCRLLLEKKKQ